VPCVSFWKRYRWPVSGNSLAFKGSKQ